MTEFVHALFTNPFLQLAMIAGIASSIAGGIIGSYVVVKRIVFISGSIAHAVLGGIGLFVFLGYHTKSTFFSPLIGSLIVAVLFGWIIGAIHQRYKQREDTVIAAIWSVGMALGVIFISITPTTSNELTAFLFGNILWANHFDIQLLIILDIVIVLTTWLLHKRFLALCFNEELAQIKKQPVKLLYFILLTLVSLTVVLFIQIIGAILVVSMLCLPAAIANFFTSRLSKMIFLAIGLSCLFIFFGLFLSFHLEWPSGATIALVSTLSYFLLLPFKQKFAC